MGLNIKDIARMANVSPATVSRVINGTGNVNEENRQRVLKVLEETGYKPNALARGLLKSRTNVIGIIVPDLSNINFAEYVKGIENEAKKHDFNILLTTSGNSAENEISYFQLFKEKRLDGIIFSGTVFTKKHKVEIEKTDIPVLVFGQNFGHPALISINIDNEMAAYEATKYLLSKGAKSPCMIAGPLWDKSAGYNRYSGFLKAIIEEGINPNSISVEEGDFSIKSGYNAMKKILKKNTIDAVLAGNDYMALGAIKCLVDENKRIPDDVQVMGFDDIVISEIYNPSLSTVKIDFHQAGKLSARKLIKAIEGEEVEKDIEFPYEIILRNTTKL